MICSKCKKEIGKSNICPECGNAEEEPTSTTIKVNNSSDFYNNFSVETQSETYLITLRTLEQEKAKSKKQNQKSILKTTGIILVIILFIICTVLTSLKIRAQSRELNGLKTSIRANFGYETIYKIWQNTNAPSDSRKKKVALKMGEYSFDNERLKAGIFFFEELNKYNDEKYNKKAIKAFDKEFEILAKKDRYNHILGLVDTYKLIGGNFNTKGIEDGIIKTVEKGDYKAAEQLILKSEEKNIFLSDEIKSKVKYTSIEAEYIGNVKAGDYINANDFNVFGIYPNGQKKKLSKNDYSCEKIKCDYGKSFDYTIKDNVFGNIINVNIDSPQKSYINNITREKLAHKVFNAVKTHGYSKEYKMNIKNSAYGIITEVKIISTNPKEYESFSIVFSDSEKGSDKYTKVELSSVMPWSMRGYYASLSNDIKYLITYPEFTEIAEIFVTEIDKTSNIDWKNNGSSTTIEYKFISDVDIYYTFSLTAAAIQRDVRVTV
ncbi:MAG: hypothetical protein IJK60_01990 [Clostridia bacterium]|nr:hypothetical protein [Clostridia bacterium]